MVRKEISFKERGGKRSGLRDRLGKKKKRGCSLEGFFYPRKEGSLSYSPREEGRPEFSLVKKK